ncbi:MAG TPA: phosphate ABC transporter substrate-binding protein [Acidimicrobiaceae bacterium]|nr:phosphate ABC transporter substrate-binding protein [Acidimicrobiaceae bacterium]
MTLTFTVSPDFNTKYLPGWFVFNTWLQRHLGVPTHFEVFDGFDELHRAMAADSIDIIYANPFDAARLVRDHGYVAVARPVGRPDEAVIATHEGSAIHAVEDLLPGTRIATTDDPDVHMMCMIMIEPADLNSGNVAMFRRDNYVLVAKSLLKNEADIGFFLAETFDDLSGPIRSQLRVLVRSQIYVINHLLLAHPRLGAQIDQLRGHLLQMGNDAKGAMALQDVAIKAWESVDQEDVEFMIDLMVALTVTA